MTEYVVARAAELTYDQFVKEMVMGDISREVFKIVKKLHPIRRVEVIKSKGTDTKAAIVQ